MLPRMRIKDDLRDARLGFDTLAEASKVNYDYLRQLSTGKQSAGDVTLRALARGLARHAARLLRIASRFLGAGDAKEAERAEALARTIERELIGLE